MLLREEMLLVVNDKENRERRFPKMRVEELNRVNSRLTPRHVKEAMVKAGAYVYICYECQASKLEVLTAFQHFNPLNVQPFIGW